MRRTRSIHSFTAKRGRESKFDTSKTTKHKRRDKTWKPTKTREGGRRENHEGRERKAEKKAKKKRKGGEETEGKRKEKKRKEKKGKERTREGKKKEGRKETTEKEEKGKERKEKRKGEKERKGPKTGTRKGKEGGGETQEGKEERQKGRREEPKRKQTKEREEEEKRTPCRPDRINVWCIEQIIKNKCNSRTSRIFLTGAMFGATANHQHKSKTITSLVQMQVICFLDRIMGMATSQIV